MKPTHCLRLGFLVAMVGRLATAAPPPVWSDDFNQPVGSAPDPAKWTYDLGGGGWGNRELEVYTDSRRNSEIVADPAATDGRALAIRVRRTRTGGYTSARLKTEGLFTPTSGRIEARIRLPHGQGLWPAFWMLGADVGTVGWPVCGEIDVMEHSERHPDQIYGTLHGPGYFGDHGLQGTYTLPDGRGSDDGYHIYAVDWRPDKIVWSVDGHVYHTCTPASLPPGGRWVFRNAPFYLILNLAVGGNWPGPPERHLELPKTLYVDYVRVYSRSPGS